MSALDAIAPLATTGIGSLPFADPVVAARHATCAYDVPFCPQLPLRDGDMIREWLGADPNRCGWSAGRDRERPAAWDAFLAALVLRPESRGNVIKLQVTGPVTLAVALVRSSSGGGSTAAVPALARELATWIAANAAEQIRTLRSRGYHVLLLADEPGLAQAGLGCTGIDVSLWDPLRVIGAAGWGLHICGAVPWPIVVATRPDVISFDAVTTGIDDAARHALDDLLANGSRIAWGILDPLTPTSSDEAVSLIARCLEACGNDPAHVATRSLLTPSCGTGRLSEDRERLLAATLPAAAAEYDRRTVKRT